MYDGLDGTFRTIRLRGRQPTCPVCSDAPTITKLIDYEQFCGAKATDKVINCLYQSSVVLIRLLNKVLGEYVGKVSLLQRMC